MAKKVRGETKSAVENQIGEPVSIDEEHSDQDGTTQPEDVDDENIHPGEAGSLNFPNFRCSYTQADETKKWQRHS